MFHVSILFLVKLIRRSTRKIRISRKSTLQFTINNILQPWAIPFHRHIPLKKLDVKKCLCCYTSHHKGLLCIIILKITKKNLLLARSHLKWSLFIIYASSKMKTKILVILFMSRRWHDNGWNGNLVSTFVRCLIPCLHEHKYVCIQKMNFIPY